MESASDSVSFDALLTDFVITEVTVVVEWRLNAEGYNKIVTASTFHLLSSQWSAREKTKAGSYEAGHVLCVLTNEQSWIWAMSPIPGEELILTDELPLMDFLLLGQGYGKLSNCTTNWSLIIRLHLHQTRKDPRSSQLSFSTGKKAVTCSQCSSCTHLTLSFAGIMYSMNFFLS